MQSVKRKTRQHRSGNSFSVRLPRDWAYPVPDQELEIERRGDELVLRPALPDALSFDDFADRARAHGGSRLGPEALIRGGGRVNPWERD